MHSISSWYCYDYEKVVEYLLENGARLDAQKNDGKTALHIATEMGYEEMSFLLSGKGKAIYCASFILRLD